MSARALRRAVAATAVLAGALAACTGLAPPAADDVSVYVLDARPAVETRAGPTGAVLAIAVPRAWPGFDTPRMAYVKQPHELEYFAKSRWADTPARMLAPLLARALEQSGAFAAIVQNPSALPATQRLDTELVRLQQEFGGGPSRVRITLRARIVDMAERKIVAAREFEEDETAASEDARAGVAALNRALARLASRLVEFCAGAAPSR